MDLQQYDRMKTGLAEILRGATMRDLPERGPDVVRDLFARLAEDRFNLVVVGRFSRGKTSLMNAMLGTDRLPTGIVPVTSVITTVTYGSEEKVVLHYANTSLFFDIPISELADHITERGNPGNRRRIATAEVQLPAELLRRGFHFVDTPGLGSSIVENTRTTEAFLPQADAFILVTSYDSPLSEEEQRILRTVHDSGRRCFIVVNKQDCVGFEQRQEVLDHLASQLPATFGAELPPLFSLSAQQAIEARLHGDAARLADSGLPALELALLDFLLNEKRLDFLVNMCSRITAILDGQAGAGQDLARLDALRAEIEAAQPGRAIVDSAAAPGAAISPTLPGCEICARVADAIFSFLAKYQHSCAAITRCKPSFRSIMVSVVRTPGNSRRSPRRGKSAPGSRGCGAAGCLSAGRRTRGADRANRLPGRRGGAADGEDLRRMRGRPAHGKGGRRCRRRPPHTQHCGSIAGPLGDLPAASSSAVQCARRCRGGPGGPVPASRSAGASCGGHASLRPEARWPAAASDD